MPESCPCGSGRSYANCCEPFHHRDSSPRTAEQLMRARYSAYVLGDGEFVLDTWYPGTCPRSIVLDGNLEWTGLEILRTEAGSAFDSTGVVEFEASYTVRRRKRDVPGRLHETLRRRGHGLVLPRRNDALRVGLTPQGAATTDPTRTPWPNTAISAKRARAAGETGPLSP